MPYYIGNRSSLFFTTAVHTDLKEMQKQTKGHVVDRTVPAEGILQAWGVMSLGGEHEVRERLGVGMG